jgi:hypothetical protein
MNPRIAALLSLGTLLAVSACRTDDKDTDPGDSDTVDTDVDTTDPDSDTVVDTTPDTDDTTPDTDDDTDPDTDDTDPVETGDTGDTDPVIIVETGDTGVAATGLLDTEDTSDTGSGVVVITPTGETGTVDPPDTVDTSVPIDTTIVSFVDTFVAAETFFPDTWDTAVPPATADTFWDATTQPFSIRGEAYDYATGTAVADPIVCMGVWSILRCTDGDPAGFYERFPPPNTNVELYLDDPNGDQMPTAYRVPFGNGNLTIATPMFSYNDLFAIGTAAGSSLSFSKGQIALLAVDGAGDPLAGVSMTVTQGTAAAVTYLGPTGSPSSVATTTSSYGVAMALNVDSGNARISWSHPSLTCDLDLGWPTSNPSETRFSIVPNQMHVATVVCQ